MAQAPTVQRAIMNRHNQARRSNSNIAPKLEPGLPLQSPQLRPTPSSHASSSPISNSSGFHNPGVMTPPPSDSQMHQQHQQQQQQLLQQQQQQRIQAANKPQSPHGLPLNTGLVNTGIIGNIIGPKGQGSSGAGSAGATPTTAAFYPSPFQNHIRHIEQLGKLSRPLLSHFLHRTMFVLG